MVRRISRKSIHLLLSQVIMSVVMNVSIIIGTGMIAELIDVYIQEGQVQFDKIILPILVCMLMGTVSAYCKKYFAGLYSIEVAREINNCAVDKLSKVHYSFFEKEGQGKIVTKFISDIGELEQYYESTLPDLINNTIAIIMVMIYVGNKNLALLIVSLCLYPIVLIVTYYFGKRLGALANKRRGKIDVMVGRVTDSINGIEIIRSYNLYHMFVSYIHSAIDEILDNEYVRAWIMHFSQTVNRLLFWIPNMLCPCLAMYMVLDGRMTIGAMTAYIVLVNKIMGGVKMMPFLLNDRRERHISIERIEKIFEEPEENVQADCGNATKGGESSMTRGKKNIAESPAVEFKNVCFAYDENVEPVLNKMTFEIPKHKTVAFVGESGQGKSTIFKLLCGFYECRSGDIYVNGENVEKIGLSDIRSQIAVVEQQAFLFEGSIYDNIAVGGINVSRKQVIDVAKQAGIHDFICKLPKQYDTVIGENGAGLSGGERQRIAIARALLKNAPILLMDEPTSSVDTETEKIISETIHNLRGKKTVLIVAHRLSTVCDADCIMVVGKGTVCEKGTHKTLIKLDGIYKRLYDYEMKGVM